MTGILKFLSLAHQQLRPLPPSPRLPLAPILTSERIIMSTKKNPPASEPSHRSEAPVAGKEFQPAEFGFVCSTAEAETIVKRRWTLEHANNAHTWNFDRESCGPALAFAA
jgi:hypothetical protein